MWNHGANRAAEGDSVPSSSAIFLNPDDVGQHSHEGQARRFKGRCADAVRSEGHASSSLIRHSLGDAAALVATAHIPEVKAIATIGAPPDVAHVTWLLADDVAALQQEGEAEVQIGGRPFRLRRSFINDLASRDQAVRIRALRKPLLILHSPQDQIVSSDNATAIFTATFHPKSFVSLDGADHMLTDRKDSDFAAAMIAA
jgi:putative redox protein